MSCSPASPRAPHPLANTPAVERDGGWWLISRSGAIRATDPAFTEKLDRFAAALAAADEAVARLATQRQARTGREPQ